MTDIETLRLRFTVDDSSLDRVGRTAATTGDRIKGTFSKAALGVGAALAAVGVGKFVGDTVKAAATFDSTLRQMAAVADVPKAQLQDLSRLALKMGADTSFSAQQAAQAMLELSKGGLSAAQIKAGALQSTLTLAAAGGLELGNAATFMSNALNGFGLQASQAADVAAALAGGANASTASVESLGEALGQVGPGAVTAGLSLQETVGALSAFHDAGFKGSDAGTSLKTMLVRLAPTTKRAADEMKRLGLDFTDAKGQFLPLVQVADQLQKRFKNLTDEERVKAFNKIFGEDAARAVGVFFQQGAKGIGKYIKATKDRGAAEKAAKARTDGAAGAMEKLKGAYETVKIVIGTSILPAVANLATGLSVGLTAGVDRVRDALGKLGQTKVFEGLKAEVGKLKDAFQTGGIKGLGSALGNLIPPGVLGVFKGIAGFVKTTLLPAFQQIGAAVLPAAAAFGKSLLPALKSLGNTFKNDVLPVLKAVGIAIGAVLFLQLTKVLPVVLRLAGPVLGFLLKAIGFVIGRVFALITGVGRVVGAIAQWSTGTTNITDAMKVMADRSGDAIATIIRVFRNLLVVVLGVFGSIVHAAATAWGWVPGLGDKLKGADKAFQRFKKTVLDTLESAADAASGWGAALASNYARGVLSNLHKAKASAAAVANVVRTHLKEGSPAKEGPLSKDGGTEGFGRIAGALYARGLASSAGQVAKAVDHLAAATQRLTTATVRPITKLQKDAALALKALKAGKLLEDFSFFGAPRGFGNDALARKFFGAHPGFNFSGRNATSVIGRFLEALAQTASRRVPPPALQSAAKPTSAPSPQQLVVNVYQQPGEATPALLERLMFTLRTQARAS